jgi:hypothetical protein
MAATDPVTPNKTVVATATSCGGMGSFVRWLAWQSLVKRRTIPDCCFDPVVLVAAARKNVLWIRFCSSSVG